MEPLIEIMEEGKVCACGDLHVCSVYMLYAKITVPLLCLLEIDTTAGVLTDSQTHTQTQIFIRYIEQFSVCM